jgi:phosphate transport system permease protein
MAIKLGKRMRQTQVRKNKLYEFQDKSYKYIALCATGIGVIILCVLLFDVFSDGLGRLEWKFFTDSSSRKAQNAGIYAALGGTLWIMALTTMIAFPIGIGAGIYLEEYNKKGRLANILEVNISNLAGIPSIIYGLLGLEVFSRTLMLGSTAITGALTLSLLILPIIIVSTREALKTVPYSLREASLALGATQWQTIWYQILPASIPGIVTGAILAISRAIGETAPLIVIGAATYITSVPTWPTESFTVLPIQIFYWIGKPQHDFQINAAAAIIVLLGITFVMNGVAVYLRYRWQKKIKW